MQYEFTAQSVIDEGRTTREAVKELKGWMSDEGFPEVPEELIVLFLLSCQNVIVDAQRTMRAYFKIKREAPELFTGRDVDNEGLQKALQVVNYVSIPKRMPNNTVIHFFKVIDTNYQNFDWLQAMKLSYMMLELSQARDPPNELVVVIDMKGVGFMHLAGFKLGLAKKYLEFLQDAMPLKMRVVHILNSNYILDKILSVSKLFIKTEMLALSHPPDTDMTQFQKEHVPATYLPKEYGGDLPTVSEMNQDSIRRWRELKSFYDAEEKMMSRYKK